jgi:hypothetical protein
MRKPHDASVNQARAPSMRPVRRCDYN